MCSLLALLSCFSMNGFYVDAQLIHSNKGAQTIVYEPTTVTHPIKGYGTINITYPKAQIIDYPCKAYGRASVGYDMQFSKRLTIGLDYSHESCTDTNADRGEERISLGITWRPFAR